ncbi:MAG: rRNA maturation RNase YbeY [Bacteroidia bacterium]
MRAADFSGLILFHYPYKKLRWRLRKPQAHKNWLRSLIKDKTLMRVDYYFVPWQKMALLHGEFDSPTPTDVITYELATSPLWAEVYISPQIVKQNSQLYSTPFPQEMRRTLVHALLHLIGYRDDTPVHRQEMRRAETYALLSWKNVSRGTNGHIA